MAKNNGRIYRTVLYPFIKHQTQTKKVWRLKCRFRLVLILMMNEWMNDIYCYIITLMYKWWHLSSQCLNAERKALNFLPFHPLFATLTLIAWRKQFSDTRHCTSYICTYICIWGEGKIVSHFLLICSFANSRPLGWVTAHISSKTDEPRQQHLLKLLSSETSKASERERMG